MTKTTLLLASIAVFTQSFSTFAGVYKCEMPGGRLAYQSQPCPITATKAIVTELDQRAEIADPIEPFKDELIESGDSTLPEEKPKTWLEKRAEERAAKKEAQKADHDDRVAGATNRLKFEELIFNRTVGIGMTREEVLEAWGTPTTSKTTVTKAGPIEELNFKRYIASKYTGKDVAILTNGIVTSFTMDECDSRRCR